jgi:phosphate transport system substrate-binding protein
MDNKTPLAAKTGPAPDKMVLHVEEIRLQGILRRFKRDFEDKTGRNIDTNRMIGDPVYRDQIMAELKVTADNDVAHWHGMLSDAFASYIKLAMRPANDPLVPHTPEEISQIKPAVASAGGKRGKLPPIATAFFALLIVCGAGVGGWAWHKSSADSRPAANAAPVVPAKIVLRLHGSNTIGEALAPALVSGFLASQGGKAIQVVRSPDPLDSSIQATLPGQDTPTGVELKAHGSATAFAALATRVADIGMSSRPIKADEVASLSGKFNMGDLTQPGSETIIGLDGLAILVHPSNPVDKLTVAQIAQVFSGQINNWKQLGGPDLPITLYARDEKSGTWDTFKSTVLERNKVTLGVAKRFESSSQLSDSVANDKSGIGFTGLPYIRQSKALAVADSDGTIALLPTAFTVGTEDYPLSRRLFLYAPAQTMGNFGKSFVDYVLSDAGQEIVRKIGFIPQNISAEKIIAPDDAPGSYKELAGNKQRLSISFRFRKGSDDLDNKGLRDMVRLTNYLSHNPGKSLYLAGFTDNVGASRDNLELSKKRAQGVAQDLQAAGVIPKEVLGFGADMPLASNDSDLGKQKNRRVEVWVQ